MSRSTGSPNSDVSIRRRLAFVRHRLLTVGRDDERLESDDHRKRGISMRIPPSILALIAAGLPALCCAASTVPIPPLSLTVNGNSAATTSPQFGVKASGGKLVSTLDGSTVELIGANFSGLENQQGSSQWPAYANTTLAFWQSVKNYQGTNINAARILVSSAFWLGYACGNSTSQYQSTVQHVVNTAVQAGLYVIIDLIIDAPNNICPIGQGGFPSSHATTFWTQIADIYKNNPAVIFELFNEPFGADGCPSACATATEWVNWGTMAPGPSVAIMVNGGNFAPFVAQNNANGGDNSMITTNITYAVPGELQLLQTVRGEGATNLVLASTGYWDGVPGIWLAAYNQHGNPDPLKNFGASWHDYPGYTLGSSGPLAIVAAGYPLVITETYGFDANMNGLGHFGTDASGVSGGAGINGSAGYAFARANNISYFCSWQVNDWSGQTVLSLTDTPPWSGCASQ